MSVSKKKSIEVAERRAKVAEMYLKGWRQSDIARHFGLSRVTITDDINICRREWKEDRLTNFDEKVADELQKIDKLESEAWLAWERSQRDAEKEVNETTADGTKTRKEKSGQYGDPRFLAEVHKCIERRCKLMGLDAPEKHEHSGAEGEPLTMEVVIKSRDEILEFKSFKERLTGANGNGHSNGG